MPQPLFTPPSESGRPPLLSSTFPFPPNPPQPPVPLLHGQCPPPPLFGTPAPSPASAPMPHAADVGPGPGRSPCGVCGVFGHRGDVCRHRANGVKCYSCGHYGHKRRFCKARNLHALNVDPLSGFW
jgi:hypothetical protein